MWKVKVEKQNSFGKSRDYVVAEDFHGDTPGMLRLEMTAGQARNFAKKLLETADKITSRKKP
jgi:hypothetical protein